MTVTAIKDPRRYFEAVDTRKRQATAPPVCLYLEVTNRCNLLCETCPRTLGTSAHGGHDMGTVYVHR